MQERCSFTLEQDSSVLLPARNSLEARAGAWAVNAYAVLKPEHGAVVSAHQDLLAIGAELPRVKIQRDGEVGTAIAIYPGLLSSPDSDQGLARACDLYFQRLCTTVWNVLK